MIQRFHKIGVKPNELEIKLFGGAHMFRNSSDSVKKNHVGSMNIHMARHMIEKFDISLKSLDVGGKYGRKIIFNTATGDVWVKRFKKVSGTQRNETTDSNTVKGLCPKKYASSSLMIQV